MPESWWGNAIFSLIPTIVLGLIFWMVLRMIIRGDRTARREYDRIEVEERIKMGLPPKSAAPASAPAQAEAPADAVVSSAPVPTGQRPEDSGRTEPPAG